MGRDLSLWKANDITVIFLSNEKLIACFIENIKRRNKSTIIWFKIYIFYYENYTKVFCSFFKR